MRIRREALVQCTSDILPTHVLYIMSNLIQKNWVAQGYRRQEQAVYTVISLMKQLRPDDLSKFLPKV
jgi:hypothetical protein